MSDYGFFWNSRDGDRKYNADDFGTWLRKFFTTGVFNGDLYVESIGGMRVSVGTGYANIEGKVMFFDEAQTFTVDVAHSSLARTDAVVVEVDYAERIIARKIIKGTPGEGAPSPERDDEIYQIVLAYIYVGAGAVSITQSNITDTRMNTALCGWVVSSVTHIDFDQAYSQFTTWFNEYKEEIIDDFSEAGELAQEIFNAWFEHMKGQLDEDAAGHLQLELDDQAVMIAENYSPAKLYAVGEKVSYENSYYICKRAVTQYMQFDPTYWDKVSVADQIDKLKFNADAGENCRTEFLENGSIVQTYSDRIKNTVFNQDGSITEALLNLYGDTYATKTTVFNADGSITEIVSKL